MKQLSTSQDYEIFGQLVRSRRSALGLSQEALAEAALGNPDRKSYVSALENNRLSKITPNTALRFSDPLGLSREDIPASLRWPSSDDPAPIEDRLRALEFRQAEHPMVAEERAIARFLNNQMASALRRSMRDVYRERLMGGLDLLQVWTGRPLGLQSLFFCYSLSLLYVVAAGLAGFVQGDVVVGAVELFRTHDWVSGELKQVLPYLAIVLLTLAVGLSCRWVRPFGRRPLSGKQVGTRLGSVALIAGVSSGVVAYMGIESLTAAVLFTVPGCAAISALPTRQAAIYGAAGGIIFGLMAAISSAYTDETWLALSISLSEGFMIGGIVGLFAGLTGSLVARKIPHLRPGQLAGAGGGIAAGALLSLASILVAANFSAVSGATLGLFSIAWVALPLANAALDFCSLGVSHWLGRYIVSSGVRTASILLLLLLDLALAVAFMIITVVVVGMALHAVTGVLGVETLSSSYLQTSAIDPWGQGIWLTLMVLSTTTWTWLHFGLVVAPLVAGAITWRVLERPAAERLTRARQGDQFDVSVGVLVTFRAVGFYLIWGAIALLPILGLALFPDVMNSVLWLGWRLAELSI